MNASFGLNAGDFNHYLRQVRSYGSIISVKISDMSNKGAKVNRCSTMVMSWLEGFTTNTLLTNLIK